MKLLFTRLDLLVPFGISALVALFRSLVVGITSKLKTHVIFINIEHLVIEKAFHTDGKPSLTKNANYVNLSLF